MSLRSGNYSLKISLKGSKPLVWRRVIIPAQITLNDLHNVIQCVMNWQDYHLHAFEIGKTRIVGRYEMDDLTDDDFENIFLDESVIFRDLVPPDDELRFTYLYDYGDHWVHDIVLEKYIETRAPLFFPVCIDGANTAPPEDCGGIHGFLHMQEVLKDPEDSEFKETLTWVNGMDYTPEFNLAEMNTRLQLFTQSRMWTVLGTKIMPAMGINLKPDTDEEED